MAGGHRGREGRPKLRSAGPGRRVARGGWGRHLSGLQHPVPIRPLQKLRLPFALAVLLGLAYAGLYATSGAAGPTSTPALRWVLAVFLAAVGVVVVQVVRFFVLDVVFVRTQGHRAPALLHAVVSMTVYFVLGLTVAGTVFGQSLTRAIATSAAASIVLGLALQDTLGNFFAGLSLQVERPYRIGDVLRVAGFEGRVDSLNWRATTIRTLQGSSVVIPNGSMARDAIEVFRRDRLNVHRVEVPAPYDVPPQHVASILRLAVAGVSGIAERPPPSVQLTAFDGSSVGYTVLYSVEDSLQAEAIAARIRERVWYAFARNGVSIPFPHEVQVPYATPAQAAEETPAEERARWLGEVDLFAPLTDEELHRLADRSRTLLYGPGETILKHGAPGGSLFVVFEGCVEVQLEQADGVRVCVAEVGAGEVIGEMSLLTGEPRSADVRAVGEVEVVEVRKPEMKEILEQNEALAEALAVEVSRRMGRRADALAGLLADAGPDTSLSILHRIRRFFDLDAVR